MTPMTRCPSLAQPARRAAASARGRPQARLSPADRAVLGMAVCLMLAAACGAAVGVFLVRADVCDLRTGAACGCAAFGLVAGALLTWRALTGW